jgi:uncharacterized protein with NRDE domain
MAFCKPLTVCTLALYYRIFDEFPLVVAANRDEHYERPSAMPTLLDGKPKIIAGKDLRAGGTWLGVNEYGLAAGILNRRLDEHMGPAAATRSRGLLCMDLLQFTSSGAAGNFIGAHRIQYNPFTALFADKNEAYVCYNQEQKIVNQRLQPGLHVFSSAAEFAIHSAKADRAYSLFDQLGARAKPTDGAMNDTVAALQSVLADHTLGPASPDPGDAICVHRTVSGTVSSSIIFLSDSKARFETFYCDGAPCRNSFADAQSLEIR